MGSLQALLVLLLHFSPVVQAARFMWFGSNVSGAEFGSNNIPGTLGVDYTWPNISSVTTLRHAGMNIFRIPFLMERLVPGQLTGQPDQVYMAALQSTVKQITDMGAYVVIDPHNFGRYYGQIISSPSQFQSFWVTLASKFSTNNLVIFDTNNEYHDMDQTLVKDLNQAAINGIRSAGATSQYIMVEGNSYSGAWTWPSVNDNLKTLTDPQNKIIYEMHQYLDSDGSGRSSNCVSSTVGAERITAATQWLKANGKKGFLGEFAGGANPQCQAAIRGMLDVMLNNTSVWLGAEWWAAGPWWGDYIFSMEPPQGIGYRNYLSTLQPYFA